MMTQSHFLITAFLGRRLRMRKVRLHMPGLLLGSLMPDVPLTLLTVGYFWARRAASALATGPLFGATYDALYFHNPIWIAATSMFHAPILIALMALVGIKTGRSWLTWFAAGCGLHTAIDVFTHHNDGPVLLFPLDWHYRFPAPISYWQPAYGGALFSRFESMVDMAILLYFVVLGISWTARRLRARHPGATI